MPAVGRGVIAGGSGMIGKFASTAWAELAQRGVTTEPAR